MASRSRRVRARGDSNSPGKKPSGFEGVLADFDGDSQATFLATVKLFAEFKSSRVSFQELVATSAARLNLRAEIDNWRREQDCAIQAYYALVGNPNPPSDTLTLTLNGPLVEMRVPTFPWVDECPYRLVVTKEFDAPSFGGPVVTTLALGKFRLGGQATWMASTPDSVLATKSTLTVYRGEGLLLSLDIPRRFIKIEASLGSKTAMIRTTIAEVQVAFQADSDVTPEAVLVQVGQQPQSLVLECSDGKWTGSATLTGDAMLHVTVGGKHVEGSPFTVPEADSLESAAVL